MSLIRVASDTLDRTRQQAPHCCYYEQGQRARRPERSFVPHGGDPTVVRLALPLCAFYRGTSHALVLPRSVPCKPCKGDGAAARGAFLLLVSPSQCACHLLSSPYCHVQSSELPQHRGDFVTYMAETCRRCEGAGRVVHVMHNSFFRYVISQLNARWRSRMTRMQYSVCLNMSGVWWCGEPRAERMSCL